MQACTHTLVAFLVQAPIAPRLSLPRSPVAAPPTPAPVASARCRPCLSMAIVAMGDVDIVVSAHALDYRAGHVGFFRRSTKEINDLVALMLSDDYRGKAKEILAWANFWPDDLMLAREKVRKSVKREAARAEADAKARARAAARGDRRALRRLDNTDRRRASRAKAKAKAIAHR